MENAAEFTVTNETNKEQSLMISSESYQMNSGLLIKTELDKFAMDIETKNQHCMDLSCNRDSKKENGKGLFPHFSHDMKPDFEYMQLESKQLASNQEAATKIINDRYRWMMENAARHKEKKEKNKMIYSQLYDVDTENINKTVQSFQNLYITSCWLINDQSKEFSDDLEMINGQSILNGLMNYNIEIDAEANIPSGVTVTEHPECTVRDLNKHMENVYIDEEKIMRMSQISQNLEVMNCEKANQTSHDELKERNPPYVDENMGCCSEL